MVEEKITEIDEDEMSKYLRKHKNPLHLKSEVKSLSIKCYEEQFSTHKKNGERTPVTWRAVQNAIKKIPKEYAYVIGIKHDKDEVKTDTFWKIATEKAHYTISFCS